MLEPGVLQGAEKFSTPCFIHILGDPGAVSRVAGKLSPTKIPATRLTAPGLVSEDG